VRLALEAHDQTLDLGRQLVGIAYGPTRTVAQRLEAAFLAASEDLAAGLAGDSELPADIGHRFAVEQLGDKPQALVHYRTLLPRYGHCPPDGGKRYLCVRCILEPMPRATQDSE
jgi:hypothetical protein